MTTKLITAANADEHIKLLYETAFPEGEQIPWEDLMRLVEEMPLEFTAFYDEDEFIGFTIIYLRTSYDWFWYFAVREDLRGKGFGQQILSLLIERQKGRTCVLDMEAIEQPVSSTCIEGERPDGLQQSRSSSQTSGNRQQRIRRHAFYLRNGFRDTHVYRTYNDITMTIMMLGEGVFTMNDWDELVGELKSVWWPDDIKEQPIGS